ncbi:hypothetical protein [Streptomyces sp. NPDC017260]|uniref:hypothetical protein n=1 Tax=unclassified Streptomyces TaxID=2593676 RepID=UPI0037A59954
MDPADQHPHLALLSEDELAKDPFPDEPFRMTFPAYWTTGADGVRRRSDIAVRLNSADITDMKMRIRAVEMAYHSRISRMSPEEIEAERRRAACIALQAPAQQPTVELLATVLVRLREVA